MKIEEQDLKKYTRKQMKEHYDFEIDRIQSTSNARGRDLLAEQRRSKLIAHELMQANEKIKIYKGNLDMAKHAIVIHQRLHAAVESIVDYVEPTNCDINQLEANPVLAKTYPLQFAIQRASRINRVNVMYADPDEPRQVEALPDRLLSRFPRT